MKTNFIIDIICPNIAITYHMERKLTERNPEEHEQV